MSPAAVDFQSPIASMPTKPASTPENPNHVPDVASSCTFNLGALNDNGSQCQFGPSAPSRLGRLRQRLVKLRKQHSRSRTGSGESGPGVNPFCSGLTLAALAGAAVVEYYEHKSGAKADKYAKYFNIENFAHKD